LSEGAKFPPEIKNKETQQRVNQKERCQKGNNRKLKERPEHIHTHITRMNLNFKILQVSKRSEFVAVSNIIMGWMLSEEKNEENNHSGV